MAEPISHFAEPSRVEIAYSIEAVQVAMSFSPHHLVPHTWTIFALPSPDMASFIHRYKLPGRVSSVFYPFPKDRVYGPIGKAIDSFAILGTLLRLSVSIGLGRSQINTGLNQLPGAADTVLPKVIITALLSLSPRSSLVWITT